MASAELMEIWQVTRIGPLDLGPDDGVTMQVADGRIAGRSGCNRYTGPVALTAETLSSGGLELGALAGTQMACPEPASRIESAFLTAIRQVDGYQLTATGGLVLTAGDSELIQAERVLPD